jgi:hypothetical protein
VRRALNVPLEPSIGQRSSNSAGAVTSRAEIPKISDETTQNLVVPVPFDAVAITAYQGDGTSTTLIGDGNVNAATLAGATNVSATPWGCVGEVNGIFPYLEGSSGPVPGPRIPGNGVVIQWQIFVNGRTTPQYGALNTILSPWNGFCSDHPLLYLRPGEQLTCMVAVTDPFGVYVGGNIGIRIRGRFVPIRLLRPIGNPQYSIPGPPKLIVRG